MKLSTVFINKETYLRFVLYTALILLVFGVGYDYVSGESPCLLCLLQRGVLLLLAIVTLFPKQGIKLIPWILLLGTMIGFRHVFVLLFPQAVTSCLPFELMMDLQGSAFMMSFMDWLTNIGRECSQEVSAVTYFLVPFLLIYYSLLALPFLFKDRFKIQ